MRLPVTRLFAVVLSALPAFAQTKPSDPEKEARARRMLLDSMKREGVEIDLEKQTVTIPCLVNDPPPPDPIEYVLVHRRGKRHEAVLTTEVKASLLNGALLMLGYEKGKNADYKEIVPPPTAEQVEKGAPV